MNLKEIYSESIRLWPKSIDLSDGKVIEETNGFYSKTMSAAWEAAEESASNEWQSLMVWVMYQALHKKALDFFKVGKYRIAINCIDILVLEQAYWEALKDKGYEEMLKQLVR